MPRPATGTVQQLPDGRYQPVLTLVSGQRKRYDPFEPGLTEQEAKLRAKAMSDVVRARRIGAAAPPLPGSPDEPVRSWFPRWCQERRRRTLKSVHTDEGRFRAHIDSVIGHLPIGRVTAEDLRTLVAELDRKVLDTREISWKTAENAWTLVRAIFRDAASSKAVGLRVRNDDPTENVESPDDGSIKRKTCLYPCEFLQLVSCEEVPLRWRRIYAVAIYTYGRASEHDALNPRDVDLDHGTIQIHRAVNLHTGDVGTPKGDAARTIQIEKNLVPLMAVLLQEGELGTLLTLTDRKKASRTLRRHLETAGISRDALFADPKDPLRKNIRFHDLRGTAATWASMRGETHETIRLRLGHTHVLTTEAYINDDVLLAQNIGEPFPPLPDCLLRSVA